MYKVSNKSIAAFAVLMMVFGGFGIALTAGADDAAARTPELIPGSIVVEDSMVIDYVNVDDDLYMVMNAELYLADGRVAEIDRHLEAFAGAIWLYYDSAKLAFVVPYETVDDKDIAEIVPASFLEYFTADSFILTVEKLGDFAILETIVEKYVDVEFQPDLEVAVTAIAAEGVTVLTEEEMAVIEASIALLQAELEEADFQIEDLTRIVEEKNADIKELQKSIELAAEEIAVKNAKIADLEKQIADTKKGDSTIAWCVAAVGIIAAVVLAGFIVIVYMKAKKEGRRLL